MGPGCLCPGLWGLAAWAVGGSSACILTQNHPHIAPSLRHLLAPLPLPRRSAAKLNFPLESYAGEFSEAELDAIDARVAAGKPPPATGAAGECRWRAEGGITWLGATWHGMARHGGA